MSNNNRLKRGYKYFLVFLMVYFSLFIFQLSARMGIAAYIIILVATLLLYWKEKRIKTKSFLLGGVILFLSVLMIFGSERNRERFATAFAPDGRIDYGSNAEFHHWPARLVMWYCAEEVILSHPLIGVGIGDVHQELNASYLKNGFEYGAEKNLNAHNQFMENGVSMGLMGLSLFLAALLLPFLKSLKQKKFTYALFLVLIFLNCLTESVLNVQKGVVFYSLFNALFAFSKFEEG